MSQSVIHNKYFTYAEHKPAFFVVSMDEDKTQTFWIVFSSDANQVLIDLEREGIDAIFIMPLIDMLNSALKKIDLHELMKSIIDG